MSHINKKLAITAVAAALTAAIGASMADTANRPDDAMATQNVEVTGAPADHQIYFFRDQGNSPETDPAAHLLLIKHVEPMPVAETSTTTTTVAQTTETTPAATDTTTDNSAAAVSTDNSATTDTTAMPADTQPALAPKADRN